MRTLHFLAIVLLMTTVAACGGGKPAGPQGRLDALVAAIKARDLEAYRACWYPERADQEGMVTELAQDPDMWKELDAMFQGPLKLEEEGSRENGGNTIKKFHVDSPEVEDGIGTISMIQDGEKWLMYSW